MFNALYLTQKDGTTVAEIRPLEDDALPQGDVTLRVAAAQVFALSGHPQKNAATTASIWH